MEQADLTREKPSVLQASTPLGLARSTDEAPASVFILLWLLLLWINRWNDSSPPTDQTSLGTNNSRAHSTTSTTILFWITEDTREYFSEQSPGTVEGLCCFKHATKHSGLSLRGCFRVIDALTRVRKLGNNRLLFFNNFCLEQASEQVIRPKRLWAKKSYSYI